MNIMDLFEEIRDDDSLLNDRREYCKEDLQSAYGLSNQDADDLYWLIQDECDADIKPFDSLNAESIKAFIQDALHSNLDGWEGHDKIVILRFISDIGRGAGFYNEEAENES
jgi:hypothetical protein